MCVCVCVCAHISAFLQYVPPNPQLCQLPRESNNNSMCFVFFSAAFPPSWLPFLLQQKLWQLLSCFATLVVCLRISCFVLGFFFAYLLKLLSFLSIFSMQFCAAHFYFLPLFFLSFPSVNLVPFCSWIHCLTPSNFSSSNHIFSSSSSSPLNVSGQPRMFSLFILPGCFCGLQ